MLMGEARSKVQHIMNVPLSPETSNELHQVYFAKGINATTAIEGNTLSEEEVQRRISKSLELPPSKEYLGTEVDNMIDAYNGIIGACHSGHPIPLTPDTLKAFNKQILDGLEHEPDVIPGEYRIHSVAVGPYVGAPAEDCEFLVHRLCDWLNTEFTPAGEDEYVPFAFIKAVVAHVYIEWIHPFGDGNGRLGRLIEFMLLTNAGVPIPAAHVLTSHYNETRSAYYLRLNAASRERDLGGFLSYAAQGFVDGLLTQIKRIHSQQERLMWRSWVDEHYQGKAQESASRQRALALALGDRDRWVAKSEAMGLTPWLATAYADKTTKTLTRDLNQLQKLRYVQVNGDRVRARIDTVRGMRPFANPNGN